MPGIDEQSIDLEQQGLEPQGESLSAASWINLMSPWPTAAGTVIVRFCTDDGRRFRVVIEDGGRLRLEHTDEDRLIASAFFQPVQVVGVGRISVVAVYDADLDELRLHINDQALTPVSESDEPIVVEAHPFPAPPPRPAIGHPESEAACHEWVEKRRKKFANAKIKPHRRQRRLERQLDDLRNLRSILLLAARHVEQGDRAQIMGVAAALRSMVYWAKDLDPEPNYSPVLLRLASRADLPLPVYVSDRTRDGAEDLRIVDLQEYLKGTAMRGYVGDGPNRSWKDLTRLELIAEIANTCGLSHVSEDAPTFLEEMEYTGVGCGTILNQFFLDVSRHVLGLADYVIAELTQRGVR